MPFLSPTDRITEPKSSAKLEDILHVHCPSVSLNVLYSEFISETTVWPSGLGHEFFIGSVLVLGMLLLLRFSMLYARPANRGVFQPRTQEGNDVADKTRPSLPPLRYCWEWATVSFSLDSKLFVEQVGLDSVLYLSFQR